jgi:hypothetical protein
MSPVEERRKSPRVAVGGQCVFRADQRVRVRLLEISAGGALLRTDERLAVGTVGTLRLSLAGMPFEATVEITREEPAPESRGWVAGASIIAVQPREQDALEDFLRRAGS